MVRGVRKPLSQLLLPLLGFVSYMAAQDAPWPYNLPANMKHYHEQEKLIKRDAEILQRMQSQSPNSVRKMSGDPGEKFFMDFWIFDEQDNVRVSRNTTNYGDLTCPLPLHYSGKPGLFLGHDLATPYEHKSSLQKRAFGCPAGTSACSSINRPNLCCPNDSTCQIVPDSGLGDVGCCEASQICAGSVAQCPQGYSSCPNNPGGGCCLPGYACFDEGCVMTSTTIVVVTPTTTTTTTLSTTTTTTTPATTTTSTTTSLTTSTTTSMTTTTIIVVPTTSVSLSPPVRPTTATTSLSISGCPTGFYACSAYYQGGCCRVGRDCASVSCPTSASVTVVSGNGITAVAPSGTYLSNTQGFLTGSCASGWSSCATDVGGGCCPTGFGCGTLACTATASGGGGAQVGKEAPQSAASVLLSRHDTNLRAYFGGVIVIVGVTMFARIELL